MTFIRGLIGISIALLIAYIAINNRQIIDLQFSPLHPPLQYPFYMFGLGFLTFGFVLGGFIVWLNSAGLRREKRAQSRTIKSLEKALEATAQNPEESHKTTDKPRTELFPALQNQATSK